jgi:hypothetical protein
MAGLRKRLLASALDYYREFIEQPRSDPDTQAELRDTKRRVEAILADLAVLRAAGELYLLIQPAAMDDLRLDEGQRARVADLSGRAGKRWMETLGNPRRLLPPAQRVRIALEQARANETEIEAILSPAQRVRLRQLALQSEAAGAFREPEVVEALGLTLDQREATRAIEDELFVRQMREMPSGKGADDTGSLAVERILAVLTPEQARRWREMAGAPVRGRLSAFPVPFTPQRDAGRTPR